VSGRPEKDPTVQGGMFDWSLSLLIQHLLSIESLVL